MRFVISKMFTHIRYCTVPNRNSVPTLNKQLYLQRKFLCPTVTQFCVIFVTLLLSHQKMLSSSLQCFSACVHPTSETTGEQKYRCADDITRGSQPKSLISISVTTHSNWNCRRFSVLLWAGFFCLCGEGLCLHRSHYLKPVIINTAASI